MYLIIYIGIGVLLPIIPAFLLYRILPSNAVVKGPFKGFNVQLTGAFAGYFLVLLVVFAFIYENKEGELWQVKGRVSFENKVSEANFKDLSILIKPPNITITNDGTFQMDILLKKGSGGKTVMPTLSIEHPNYQTATVYLEKQPPNWGVYDSDPTYSGMDKTITLNNQINLIRK